MKQYTSAIIFDPSRTHILLLKRADHKKTHPGYITGFGGHVEMDETPEQCIERELIEETGLTVSDLRRVAVCQFDDSDGYGNREIVIFECVAQTLDIVADANDGAALVLPFRTKNIHELRNNYTEACWFSLQHLLAEKQDILTITSQMRDKEIARKTK